MKMKLKKYWGDFKKMNMLLMVALVLDPRFKSLFEYGVEVVDGDSHRKTMKKVNDSLKTIFEQYKTKIMGVEHHVTPTGPTTSLDNACIININAMFWKASGNVVRPDSVDELTIARDLLTILVSTVASESAFSTGGRVTDDYHSRLSPRMVQALFSTQDWARDFT